MDERTRPWQPGEDPALKVIHAAMLGGTLLFFSVGLFMFGGRETDATSPIFRWAWLGVAVATVFAVGAVRGRLSRQAGEPQVRAAAIVIWALAEATALVGIVSTIVTGDSIAALGATSIGVFLMLHHRPSQL